jgi:uncharacterized protein
LQVSHILMNRLPRLKLFGTVCLLLCLVRPGVAEDIKAIHPTGYVTDLAHTIDSQTKLRLEELCTELEQKTGAQMAIVTVHGFEGESVENYAVDLYKQLGVGDKKEKRGVLLLVSPDERKYRIEVGYGLEPVINDARAGDAGRAMVPFLRIGDYSKAVAAAAWQIAKYIADDRGVTLSNQPRPAPLRQNENREHRSSGRIWLPLILVGFFFLWRLLAAPFRGGRGGGGFWMGSAGGWGGGGWTGGGFGGSSGGGSGGGFGGFGGGDSGGGGASGSW